MRATRQVPGRVRRQFSLHNARVRALVWAGIALFTVGWVSLAVLWIPNVVLGVVLAGSPSPWWRASSSGRAHGDHRAVDPPGERGTHAVRDDAPAEAG